MRKIPHISFFTLCFIAAISLIKCSPEDNVIFKSEHFTIYPNRVIQGQYEASATNNTQINSNYNSSGEPQNKIWALEKDISYYPQYESKHVLLNAIYNLSLEEVEKNIASDSTFNTGEKWQGVWTRDISYSTILALAITNPSICMNSLMKKVKNDRIIQDTGTGGSWPVSTDRMIWSTAAWEVYKVTGDLDWLRKIYFIVKNSTDDDLNVAWNYQKHLFRGESSFLDWREQSYPEWMEPIDIYSSYSLNTQIVHYQSLQMLIKMGTLLQKDIQKYKHLSEALKKSINNNFWLPQKGYYGQFIYGNKYPILCDKSESLGEALSILWDVASPNQAKQIVSNTPITEFGTPCIFPAIPNIPPYHNQAVWPFVQAYWNWASTKAGNMESLERGMANIIRSSALFLTNKENYLIDNGDFNGTEINSDRQLWSVAGSLSLFYRSLMGINFNANELRFNPLIPRQYKGKQSLKGLRYRNAVLDIEILGFGNQISSYQVDGVNYRQAIIPKELEGHHKITIMMNNHMPKPETINLVKNTTTPKTPAITYSNEQLRWNKIKNADHYKIYQNGELLLNTRDTFMSEAHFEEQIEFTLQAVDSNQNHSFLSKPIYLYPSKKVRLIEAEQFIPNSNRSYVALSKKSNLEFLFKIRAPYDGEYYIDFLYANGNGPINTDNKCAIRSFWVNNAYTGSIVFPQRGKGAWADYGFTNAFEISMKKGYNFFKISFENFNNNMNEKVNSARIDKIRIIRIR